MPIDPMMPYQKWQPPEEWFDSPEWVVADALLTRRTDGWDMASLTDQEACVEDAHLALNSIRAKVGSDDFAVICGKVYAIDEHGSLLR